MLWKWNVFCACTICINFIILQFLFFPGLFIKKKKRKEKKAGKIQNFGQNISVVVSFKIDTFKISFPSLSSFVLFFSLLDLVSSTRNRQCSISSVLSIIDKFNTTLFRYTYIHTRTHCYPYSHTYITRDARGVNVIVAGNGHGDASSNPERDWLHFT